MHVTPIDEHCVMMLPMLQNNITMHRSQAKQGSIILKDESSARLIRPMTN